MTNFTESANFSLALVNKVDKLSFSAFCKLNLFTNCCRINRRNSSGRFLPPARILKKQIVPG
ncbi:MAG: hypothetical protein PT119_19925 [Aphanizomenon gracile PMC627.10]|nr:hypothetical protein [Aphanizomenon gracile PMC627.10]